MFTAPWTLTVGWGWVLLMFCLGACRDLKWEPTGVLTAVWREWVVDFWKYSTTIGRGIIYQPTRRAPPGEPMTRTQEHEHVHIRQNEDLHVLGFIIAAVIFGFTRDWKAALVLWWSSGLWLVPNFLTTVLRGGHIYRDTEHERSAYAQTDLDIHNKSWLSDHLATPRKW